MSGAFEAGLPATRRNASVIGTGSGFTEDGSFSRENYSRVAQSKPGGLLALVAAAIRLVIPVILLLVTFGASYLYNDTALSSLGIPADGLTLGYLLLPTTFFAVQLTNRRYGPGYAFAQILATWAIAATGLIFLQNYAIPLHLPNPFPTTRILGAFAAGLFFAQCVSVIVFDGARGPRWWSAPLFSSLWGAAVFCLVFYPLAYLDTTSQWPQEMGTAFALMAGMAVLLIAPYWLLRPLVRPLPGYGGY